MTILEQIKMLATGGPFAKEVYSYLLDYQKPLVELDLNALKKELAPESSIADVIEVFERMQALDLGCIELPTRRGGGLRFHWNEDVVRSARIALGTGPIAPVISLRH